MPTYLARCNTCSHEQDYIRKIDDRHNTPLCEQCSGDMTQALTVTMLPVMAISETMNVVSPIDGSVLRSRYDYEAHMKKHNVRPTSEFDGVKKEEPKIDKKKIREAASRAYDDLMKKK